MRATCGFMNDLPCEKVWFLRNQLVHGVVNQDVEMVLLWSKDFLHEFQSSNDVYEGLEIAAITEFVRWCPLAAGFYKINTDAALVVRKNIVGVGVVIQDHLGQVMASTTEHLEVSILPKLVETVAILRGIDFAVD